MLTIEDAYLFADSITKGDTLYMQAIVSKTTRPFEEEDVTVWFQFDGVRLVSRTMRMQPGEQATFQQNVSWQDIVDTIGTGTFTMSALIPGEASFTNGSVDVIPQEPNIQTSCTDPSPDRLQPGETVTVTGTISNTGTVAGEVTYEWVLNGNRLGTTATVTVQAGGDVGVETNAPYDRVVQVAGTGTINVGLNPISVQQA